MIGTVMESSHIPMIKWALAFHLMASSKKGYSAHQLMRTLGLGSYRTAWFMAHRIREAMFVPDPEPFGGKDKVVEVDETFIGKPESIFVSGKGWQDKRGTATKRKVMTLVERGGRAKSFKVKDLDIKTINKVLWRVNHSEGEYVRGDVTTNTVEGFFGIFKRGMTGVYQHCGETHLQAYLNEFDFRYSNRVKLGVDDAERTRRAIKGAEGKRLTYNPARSAQSDRVV
jgi:hypothetical protein